MSKLTATWFEANQRYLNAALGMVRDALARHGENAPNVEQTAARASEMEQAAAEMPSPPALETLCTTFGLSVFERDFLLMCAGMELDAEFAALCAQAQGNAARTYPTASLALAALAQPHWSALTPDAPLRHWRLIEFANNGTLTTSPVRIDERILHYLAGVTHMDERLVGLAEPVAGAEEIVPSQVSLAEQIAAAWTQGARNNTLLPVIQLCGRDLNDALIIGSAACRTVGLQLYQMGASVLPTNPSELESLARLWLREAALGGSALLIDCHDRETSDATHAAALRRLAGRISSPLIIAGRERRDLARRANIVLDVQKPTWQEQRNVWQRTLGTRAERLNGQLDQVIAQFNLSVPHIESASAEALARADEDQAANLGDLIWECCRAQARPSLDDLAQRIQPIATWDDLVLPEGQKAILREVSAHVRQRPIVYDQWGFGAQSARGLGISALFAGASGTGKTMAAEVLANELALDLYRIDLSQVVSKYIGETEKNLRRVFDAAEDGGAILLFDEADALFGKRSEVKDSHDRYSNIEVSYLLQRMEAYRGLAILTTNIKSALDSAFLRRIRFVVQFPFPDAALRAEIWRRIFPVSTPTERLDIDKLARLNVAGGNIRNIGLNAAFLAADAHHPVGMAHLKRAAQSEYAKLEKPLTDAETSGWV